MILLTNDDGRDAEGFKLLREAVHLFLGKDTYEAAPVGNWSGAGSSIKLRGLVGPQSPPLDHLRLALSRVKPDWVFAGLNDGANIGREILTSGTVCLAAYAAEAGIPAAAFSQHRGGKPDFSGSRELLGQALQELLKQPPPAGCFFNVNLPMAKRECRGVFWCKERGEGGYLPTYTADGEQLVEWRAESAPERMLDEGYIVVQLVRPFSCV